MNEMRQLLLDAAAAHPERAEFDRAVAAGVDPVRAGRLLAPQPMLTLRVGRSTWRVQNNPATLEAHAAAVAKCPGFNGKKAPKPRAAKGARVMYWHPELGFKLCIPQDLITTGESKLQLGSVTLRLLHTSRTIKGTVPPGWLEDLNVGAIDPEFEDEPLSCVEDLV